MICEDPATNEPIIDAIIWWHRHGALPQNPPAGLTLNNGNLEIAYGYGGDHTGDIRMISGQFQVNGVRAAGGNFVAPQVYNHQGQHTSQADYIAALTNPNLDQNQGHFSAIVIMTAECCRSSMVSQAMNGLWTTGTDFNDEVWGGIHFALTTYGHTSAFMGFDINAGQSPWTWLSASNYLSYINSDGFTGNVDAATAQINAVKTYVSANHADMQ